MKEPEFGNIFIFLLLRQHQRKNTTFPDRVFLLIVAQFKVSGKTAGKDMALTVFHVADHNKDFLDIRHKPRILKNLRQRNVAAGYILLPQ